MVTHGFRKRRQRPLVIFAMRSRPAVPAIARGGIVGVDASAAIDLCQIPTRD